MTTPTPPRTREELARLGVTVGARCHVCGTGASGGQTYEDFWRAHDRIHPRLLPRGVARWEGPISPQEKDTRNRILTWTAIVLAFAWPVAAYLWIA